MEKESQMDTCRTEARAKELAPGTMGSRVTQDPGPVQRPNYRLGFLV